jgi:hypothetical protein
MLGVIKVSSRVQIERVCGFIPVYEAFKQSIFLVFDLSSRTIKITIVGESYTKIAGLKLQVRPFSIRSR